MSRSRPRLPLANTISRSRKRTGVVGDWVMRLVLPSLSKRSAQAFALAPALLIDGTRVFRAVLHQVTSDAGHYGVKISFAAEYEAPGVGPPEITYIRPA